MRYIEISEPGGPEVLRLADCAVPAHADDEVLIKVAAAGVNRPDVMQRKGLYPSPPGASTIIGLEVSGSIEAIGKNVVQWQVGDQVCALTNGGAYAEFVNVPAGQCLPVPRGWTLVEAAGLAETNFTVWGNVFDRAKLRAVETFLVHGGSSGIGTSAIQMAVALGSRVFTTAGSEDKCQVCRNLGAEVAVNYRQEDFVEVLMEATSGNGVDVILDMVGGDYINRNIKLAAVEGRIVCIAFQAGHRVEVNFTPLLQKRLVLTGSSLRPQSSSAKAGIARQLKERVWPEIEGGRIKPVINSVFPLAEASEAHKLMESGQHIGKIILEII